MKRLLKVALVAVLAVAVVGAAVAFKPAKKTKLAVTTWYTLALGANPHDPSQYTLFGTSDPGFSTGTQVAAIKIDPGTELYGSGTTYPNKPIVDDNTATLYQDIDDALDIASNPPSPAPIPNRVELR